MEYRWRVYFMYVSCIFHIVCASFSTLATRELADAKGRFQWNTGFRVLLTCHLADVTGAPRALGDLPPVVSLRSTGQRHTGESGIGRRLGTRPLGHQGRHLLTCHPLPEVTVFTCPQTWDGERSLDFKSRLLVGWSFGFNAVSTGKVIPRGERGC